MKRIAIAGLPENTGNYSDAFTRLGAVCVSSPDPDALSSCAALILPGGGDIDPVLLNEENQGSRKTDPILDRQQLAVLDRFVHDGKPVLGICKGMQLINLYFGGTLIQDLPTNAFHQYIGRDQIHGTSVRPGTLLFRLYGKNFPVNSAHHQGIGIPGGSVSIIQHAPDSVAEGIVHDFLPVIGVQWHPERMCFTHRRPDTPDGSLLLSAFLSMCG